MNTSWDEVKIKYLYKLINGGTPKSDEPSYWEPKEIDWLTPEDLSTPGKEVTTVKRKISKKGLANSSATLVNENSVSISTRAPIGNPKLVPFKYATNQGCKSLSVKQESQNSPNYLYYFLSANEEIIKNLGRGTTFLELSNYALNNFKILSPSIEEQRYIVKFLDIKTSEIDTLISDKEKLIKLLEEKRQAVITEAVTKGLDLDVKMKDSGVEWIGEIPEHWTTSKIKYLSNHNLIYGANASAELDDEHLPRYIRITDIDKNGYLREETFRSLPRDIASKYPLNKGDILFARSGATVGKTYIHQENSISTYAGYLIKFQSDNNKLNPKFLYYYTKSFYYGKWIEANTIQATIENVSAEKYKNMWIPYPPIGEQYTIVEFLEGYIADNYTISKELEDQINKLKEYRQALIYEAVTGKIDVQEMMKETEQEEVSSS